MCRDFGLPKDIQALLWPSGIAFSLVAAPGIVPMFRVAFALLNQHWKSGGPQEEDVLTVNSTRGDYKKSPSANKAGFWWEGVWQNFGSWVSLILIIRYERMCNILWGGRTSFYSSGKKCRELTPKGTTAHILRTEGIQIQHSLWYHQLSLMRIKFQFLWKTSFP